MHLNTYPDKTTGRRLSAIAKQTGKSRKALIRKEKRELVNRHVRPQWPQRVMEFSGIPDIPPFESSRESLTPL